MSRAIKISSFRLGVEEYTYWKFVSVDNFTSPKLHNQINLGINVLCSFLKYGNNKIENTFVEVETVRNSLHVIDSPIDDKIKLRFEFDMFKDGKQLIKIK